MRHQRDTVDLRAAPIDRVRFQDPRAYIRRQVSSYMLLLLVQQRLGHRPGGRIPRVAKGVLVKGYGPTPLISR